MMPHGGVGGADGNGVGADGDGAAAAAAVLGALPAAGGDGAVATAAGGTPGLENANEAEWDEAGVGEVRAMRACLTVWLACQPTALFPFYSSSCSGRGLAPLDDVADQVCTLARTVLTSRSV